MELSVVLPAYREEQNLRLLLPRLKAALGRLTPDHELLVVDSFHQADATAEICQANGARCVNRRHSDLFGDAVRTGIEEARGRYVIFMDADGSHAPEFIEQLYNHREEADIVIASRYIEGGDTENNPLLIAMSYVLNWIYGAVLGIKCRDISNSFKLYRAEQLKALKLYCGNFDIVEEILVKLVRNNKGARIKELPFTFEKRKFGETKRNLVVFIFSFLVTLLKLRFGK